LVLQVDDCLLPVPTGLVAAVPATFMDARGDNPRLICGARGELGPRADAADQYYFLAHSTIDQILCVQKGYVEASVKHENVVPQYSMGLNGHSHLTRLSIQSSL
jgi:hypothetical protein